ncbi:MAG: hypothetical protein CL811_04730 [Colwelliaceae bacterium]|nr:hypothetical protein [Colwelliaceae bacterium]|tara:strand:+ start:6967 stop:7497 length:531 start_codon:yes stop_codon:yes gene_type:complete
MKRSKLIIIRGSPATGKTTLAQSIIKHYKKNLKNKVALLTLDEFKWVMTAHEERDRKDFEISFKNYLFSLENYLKQGYIIVTEDCFVKKYEDKSTDILKAIKLAKKYEAKTKLILLKGNWDTVIKINKLRPMVIPKNDLRDTYNKVYSYSLPREEIIEIDKKTTAKILKEAINLIK